MKAKPVVPRELANRDVDEAIAYYLEQEAPQAARGFIAALEQAYAHVARYPQSGSPRYAHEMDLPGLRCWSLSEYPYLIFYVELGDRIDVWRVLHGQRDISAWMQAPETPS